MRDHKQWQQWEVEHLCLCLWEQYRFDPRPDIREVMRARDEWQNFDGSLIALLQACEVALPLFQEDRSKQNCPEGFSWIDGILKVIDR